MGWLKKLFGPTQSAPQKPAHPDYVMQEYNALKSNNYDLGETYTTFSATLLWTAITRMKRNRAFNASDFSFCVEAKTIEIKSLADQKMQGSGKGNYTAVDVETTGLSAVEDRIVQIAAVKVRNFEIIDKFEMLVNPKKRIPMAAQNIHGIDNEMVRDEPTIDKVLPLFCEFIGNDLLVFHNSSFDLSFIKNAYRKVFDKEFKPKTDCTMKLFRARWLEAMGRETTIATLGHVTETLLGMEEYWKYKGGAHNALTDAIATAKIYSRMVS